MVDVCFVHAPYGAVERPSIALGLLHAALESTDVSSTVWYANLEFAERIEPDVYYAITVSPNEELLGEWTFSRAAFPEFVSDDDAYLASIRESFERVGFLKYLLRPKGPDLEDLMLKVRDEAERFVDEAARRVLSFSPRIVGCSSTFQQHTASLAMLRRVKELDPDVMTMMGGANCEGDMGRITHAAFPWVDFVVSGDAETLVHPLCRAILDGGRKLTNADLPSGVIGPDRPDDSIEAPRSVLREMDRSPIPDYESYFQQLGAQPFSEFVDAGILLETSRGCWWGAKHHCTFCGLNGHGMGFRTKSPGRVVDEIRSQSLKYKRTRLEAVDNILSLAYVQTVLPTLSAAEEDYEIFFEIKSNMRRADLEVMADAGIRWVQPGIESLHDGVLDLVDKGCTGLMNVQYLRWSRELGIRSTWNFLSELPGESDDWYDEMADLVPWIEHFQPPDGFSRAQYHRFSPYHERADSLGIRLRPSNGYKFVYPLERDQLMDLAYFFEDDDGSCRQRYSVEEEKRERPGLERLRGAVRLWRAQWWSASILIRPTLSVTSEGDSLVFFDNRAAAVKRDFELRGIDADIYRACDTIQSETSLMRRVIASPDEIRRAIGRLVGLKILLEMNGKYLGLALNKPYREFSRSTPLGSVDILGYRRAHPVPVAAGRLEPRVRA